MSVVDTTMVDSKGKDSLAQRAGLGKYSLHGRLHNRDTVLAKSDRVRQVTLLVLQGQSPPQIAEQLGIDIKTVKADIVLADGILSVKLDREKLRSHQTGLLLGVQDVALDRYLKDGNTVEGRLVADYGAGLRKLHGLDITEVSIDIGGALAQLMDSMDEE